MVSVEVLITGEESTIGRATVNAALLGARDAGLNAYATRHYKGGADWLCLFGVGDRKRDVARRAQIAAHGRVACWDLGYVSAGKDEGQSYLRVSVDHNHPHRLMDNTPDDPERWDRHGIALREDADPDGHIVVVGMGPKSRAHLHVNDWEIRTLRAVQARFPGRRVLYRPKPQKHRDPNIAWEPRDGMSPIEDVLRDAKLAVCRHSNVAIDACIAGVPVECEDGAAFWLYKKSVNPNREQRFRFLCKLAHWQWQLPEMVQAWKFLLKVCDSRSAVAVTS